MSEAVCKDCGREAIRLFNRKDSPMVCEGCLRQEGYCTCTPLARLEFYSQGSIKFLRPSGTQSG